ncbi:MAG: TolC family protein [Muribaculaceae bacterium]|nr:TolC family protein [Muribaculaceae bacterium]
MIKIQSIARPVIAAFAVAMLTGCGLYKKYETPTDTPLQQEYAQAKTSEGDARAFGNMQWQEVFTDPVLVDLINQALANNVDLANAKLNVDIAHANLRGARMSYFPSLTLTPTGGASSVSNGKLTGWNYTIPLTASWEVDIFGKLLNNKRLAESAEQQAKDYEQAVRSQIIGGVANCYYSIAILEAQLQLTRETAVIWGENVQTMKDYKLAGRTNEAAVVQSQANYLSVLSSISDIEIALDKANNTMSLLLNVMPQRWTVSSQARLAVPVIYRDGVPMRELAARPDVRAAEESLAQAYYTTNIARAAFYPGLTITANYGFTNMLGSFIKNPGDWFASLAGTLVAPIFSRGQNIARLEAAKARQKQSLNTFQYTLLSATAEVSDALTTYDKNCEKSVLLAEQVQNLEKAVDYTKELFAAASSTYLEILTSQSSLLSAQMAQLNCELAKAQAVINLYQSLGGGR